MLENILVQNQVWMQFLRSQNVKKISALPFKELEEKINISLA